MKRQIILLISALCFSLGAFGQGKELFSENFEKYKELPELYSKDCSLVKADNNQSLLLKAADDKNTWRDAFSPGKSLEINSEWNNCELTFRFRFPGKAAMRKAFYFSFVVKYPERLTVYFFANRLLMETKGFKQKMRLNSSLKKLGFKDFQADKWYSAKIKLSGKWSEVYFLDDGEFKLAGTCDMSGNKFTAMNIGMTKRNCVELDDIKCVAAASAPIETPAGNTSKPSEHGISLPPDKNTLTFDFLIGKNKRGAWELTGKDGQKVTINLEAKAQNSSYRVDKKTHNIIIEDSILYLTERQEGHPLQDMSIFTRPDLKKYYLAKRKAVIDNIYARPGASETWYNYKFVNSGSGMRFFINDQYCGEKKGFFLKEIAIRALPSNIIKSVNMASTKNSSLLPLSSAVKSSTIANMSFSQKPDITFKYTNIDLSKVKMHLGGYSLECNAYTSRSAFSGMPDSFIWSIPPAEYINAYVLCTVIPDDKKVPVLTARLARFTGRSIVGRSEEGILDHEIMLSPAAVTANKNIRKVGIVEYTKADKSVKLPLYLVKIPLDCGKIADLIFSKVNLEVGMLKEPYLDFELLGPRGDNGRRYWEKSFEPDAKLKSSVQAFGVTLEKSPVEMRLKTFKNGSYYYPGEKAGVSVLLEASKAGKYDLQYKILDRHGKLIDSKETVLDFNGQPGKKKIDIELVNKDFGWYEIVVELKDQMRNKLLQLDSSLVLLPENKRKAGFDSPYFSYWHRAHGLPQNLELVGPLLKAFGCHYTMIPDEYDLAGREKWKLSDDQIPYLPLHRILFGRGYKKYIEPDRKKRQQAIAYINKWIKNNPNVRNAKIFHESYTFPKSAFPLELYGIKSSVPEKQKQYESRLTQYGRYVAELYRKEFPQIKLVVGNSGDSLRISAAIMRNKFPGSLIDYLGDEVVGREIIPEWNSFGGSAHTFYYLREMARKFGYGEIALSACSEWRARERKSLGKNLGTSWRIRDALIAHAYRSPLIPLAGIVEPSFSYFNSLWGSGAMFRRYENLYPTVNFAASSTLTAVLDKAEFIRLVPTASDTIYVLEFKSYKGMIYVYWIPRGKRNISFNFAGQLKGEIINMCGKRRFFTAEKFSLTTSAEPGYLIVPGKVESVSIQGDAETSIPSGVEPLVADKMDNAAIWTIDNSTNKKIDEPLKENAIPPFRQPGRLLLRQAKDKHKGNVLEVELDMKPERKNLDIQFYGMLRPTQDIILKGKPTTIGMWVKGDSSWTHFMWEFKDAKGQTFFTSGNKRYFSCDNYDWSKMAAVNFDGWNFIQFPLNRMSPVRDFGPGSATGRGGVALNYPIRFTGLMILMPQNVLKINELKQIQAKIRLSDLSSY